MTWMAGPDCAVMCNLINMVYIHTPYMVVIILLYCLKENQNAPRPSEHYGGKNVKILLLHNNRL